MAFTKLIAKVMRGPGVLQEEISWDPITQCPSTTAMLLNMIVL